jgi:ribosomal protein S18 acetylase RimI-like enzyme
MKIKLRKSNNNDLDLIYQLHIKCFDISDQWYKSIISQYLHNGYILELIDKTIIGVLLQGDITICNNDTSSIFSSGDNIIPSNFIPTNEYGNNFFNDSKHLNKYYGITMICIDPKYRGKGLSKKLINQHIIDNPNKLLCLNTRQSNTRAYQVYQSMNYEQIGIIKNKYFQPNEDAILMVHIK